MFFTKIITPVSNVKRLLSNVEKIIFWKSKIVGLFFCLFPEKCTKELQIKDTSKRYKSHFLLFLWGALCRIRFEKYKNEQIMSNIFYENNNPRLQNYIVFFCWFVLLHNFQSNCKLKTFEN